MTIEFKGSNAVILPSPIQDRQFNPAIFSQIWMIQHLHVEPNDFINEGSVQSPILFHQSTRQFSLFVAPERVQLGLATQQEREEALVRRILLAVLGQFPANICHAIGVNFNWMVRWDERPNSETSRRLFFGQGNPLFRFFDTDDACFGVYASKDFLGVRLKVDAKPLTMGPSNEITTMGVFFNFNFHKDLSGEDRIGQIGSLLARWEEARNEASRIVQQLNTECDS